LEGDGGRAGPELAAPASGVRPRHSEADLGCYRHPGRGRPSAGATAGGYGHWVGVAEPEGASPGFCGYERDPVLLVGGNKAGNWKRWYDQAIPEAEQAYANYLQEMKAEGGKNQ